MLVRPGWTPEAVAPPWNMYASERHIVLWVGHIFMSGSDGGGATIERLCAELRTHGIHTVAQWLRGIFGLLILDRDSGTWHALVDNGGFYRLYRDSASISASFLQLVRAQQPAPSVSLDRVVEYLMQGQVYGGHTLVAGIRKLRYDEIIVLPRNGRMRVEKKALPTEPLPTGYICRHFDDLAEAMRGRRLSCDITGGYDTRLIVALLDAKGLEYELAVSGREGADDVEIAREIAKVLDRPLFVSAHTWHDLEMELCEAFEVADGQIDPVFFHRDLQNAKRRKERGVEIITHGGGGGHYSDHDFVQDFPWYGSSTVQLRRFYDLRCAPVRIPTWHWTEDARRVSERIPRRTIARFLEHRRSTNHESYNRAAYFVRMPESFGPHLSAYINMGINVAAPLLDYDNMRACFAIPPWQRFMTRWHRDVITTANPAVARIRTSVGYTASNLWRDAVRNAVGFVGPQIRRLGRKIGQRTLGRSMFFHVGAPALDDVGFRPAVRRSGLFADAVEELKRRGVLSASVRPEDILDHHVPAVLNAGLIGRYCKQQER